MNPVLKHILATKTVSDGHTTFPLQFEIPPEEGEFLQHVIAQIQPKTFLEIGMAYGVSTLFICEALARLPTPADHIVIDPFQTSQWLGIGLRHLREAGYERLVRFYEERSEFILPRLVAEGTTVDLAFIDGWHTFDQTLVDFYFLNRMLRVGGVVIFDDARWPSIHRVARHVLTYPAYELFSRPGPEFRHSLLGRLRLRVARRKLVRRILHPDLLRRPWDIGPGRYIAFRKVAPDQRSTTWYEDF